MIMGKSTTCRRGLFFESKLLCFSLLYLLTSLFLALYTSLSNTKCLFRSSPFEPLHIPLFTYPSSYGQHKYAISTLRSTCSSPVFFSDYLHVLKEIQDLSTQDYSPISSLKYMQRKAETFGGKFSAQERFSYFDQSNVTKIPCGFFKDFPISDYDRNEMENCRGVVVVSAIFNDHDKIRQPKGLGSKTLDNVCFYMFIDDVTHKGLKYHKLVSENNNRIGAWRIVKVLSKDLYENPAMNGVIAKYLIHRLFPNVKFSIWVDAKLQLMVDPLLLIHGLVVSKNVDMAISKHPFYIHTMEEAMATLRWKKWWDVIGLRTQIETYCEFGLQPWSPNKLPYPSDVPDSALIIRKHGLKSNLFSCLMFNELEGFNPRDQLAFAFVRDQMRPKLEMNMFEVEVFEQIAVEYRHNIIKYHTSHHHDHDNNSTILGGSQSHHSHTKNSKIINHSLDLINYGSNKCQKYLSKMWDESR
ncbi:alkaline ceramidase TOD1 [Cannabis sativa]|uniref:alkaline ceramidase TOD1 n=1 Tax=Cannabis sativa TaxID=3483 RepID=UPI0029CA1169|nr:alkaline ceramidase TOD1 [Cannabis sativa]